MDHGTPTPSLFLSHWRGETSLGISYWLNGILLGSLLPTLILIGYSRINPFRHSLRMNACVILILFTLRLCLWIWTNVGVIRSANRHTSRGGKLLEKRSVIHDAYFRARYVFASTISGRSESALLQSNTSLS